MKQKKQQSINKQITRLRRSIMKFGDHDGKKQKIIDQLTKGEFTK